MIRHLRAILILPFMVTIVIPSALLMLTQGAFPSDSITLLPAIGGVVSIGAGLSLLWGTIRLFDKFGDGTLAPWDPPEHLVVIGIYRYMRNPMIAGVFMILLGEVILTQSLVVAGWMAFFIVAKLIYITFSEEPTLIERFGDDYKVYQAHVPSWIPRLSPWIPLSKSHS